MEMVYKDELNNVKVKKAPGGVETLGLASQQENPRPEFSKLL